ncbi:MAG: CcoQ/FixQ family Cbb3-type cytochrome c oxidase assembly chaperone [Oceanospirillaceae bacterium]|uniref:cbb3-type cytochrome oxidase subunit 3 n=1 Tax=unclassified Thalassolituus TaxID=2624967 RepID=UPI000C55B8AB|nr:MULTISPECIES: cbb3-type cytochrome c oxidase subunit 3 [unclassified Thalassolituus]MAS23803.1 CcoQ/FixQ family Cbb3-type cytochrome c oxidase assembly chaperone [Oceanospirillaceae bacterium]MAX98242.1 CcoQ/FixQ family Cbb3-type cytochrome c oxidase assembly chaperone [Oceanospirillaceae bacterium]MBM94621.1 CcoQ/FixQ family Cbb3-type cytochrome c oxidase assembly chaperone [Oceanospirillaceae bacterium]MBS53607.1 CcoQ/FixQ family Cbb3-type cytochrome c oxidase assembly chaperone [Oceanospi|tara:strand:- start:181 stop:360 length:180 start_codon:yes stop_codon:yes gene_type:complete
MDINDVRGLGSVFALIAFSAIIWWAYGSSRRKRFEDDAHIPFRDEDHENGPHGDKDRSN